MASPRAERFGHVFLFRPKDVNDERLDELKNDSKSIQDTFKYLGFKSSKENREEVIEKKEELEKHLKQSVYPTASVIFVHIIATVVKLGGKIHLLDKDSRMLALEDVMKIFAERKNKETKIVIFLQELNSTNENKTGRLFNRATTSKGPTQRIPEYILIPQNILLATLPEKVHKSSNLVEILCEELRKAKDIDSALTSMIGRASNAEFSPMFSSTMFQTLSMEDWGEKNVKIPMVPKEVSLCLRAWLIGKFERNEPLHTEEDEKSIKEAFQKDVKKHSIKTGNVQRQDIFNDLKANQKFKECEFLVLIISSHGSEGGIIHTSDGQLTWEKFFESIKHLEDIPKLIIADLCRGTCKGTDSVKKGKESITRGPAILPIKLPKNTMMIFSSTEGAMSYQVKTGYDKSIGSALINTFCSILKEGYFKGQADRQEKNLFTLTHETMMQVQKIYEYKEAKKAESMQQVTFISTMPDVYRFKYNAIN